MPAADLPHRSSLLRQLMGWLLLPLALLAALDLWITYRDARQTATLVQQRMLLGAARMIGQQIEIQDGQPNAVLPPVHGLMVVVFWHSCSSRGPPSKVGFNPAERHKTGQILRPSP